MNIYSLQSMDNGNCFFVLSFLQLVRRKLVTSVLLIPGFIFIQ